MKLFFSLLFIVPFMMLAQEKPEKEKFVSETTFHVKAGTILNFRNAKLFEQLNTSGSDVFTSTSSVNANPLVHLEFDNHFLKCFGFNIALGFMQTRSNYHYESVNYNMYYSANPANYKQDGLILCNIPHLTISPSFYIYNTRFNVGLGLYKYYYSFNPSAVGNLYFDLNSEGLLVYSSAGVTQTFDVKHLCITASVNYFGFTQRYDHGFQISLGTAF